MFYDIIHRVAMPYNVDEFASDLWNKVVTDYL